MCYVVGRRETVLNFNRTFFVMGLVAALLGRFDGDQTAMISGIGIMVATIGLQHLFGKL